MRRRRPFTSVIWWLKISFCWREGSELHRLNRSRGPLICTMGLLLTAIVVAAEESLEWFSMLLIEDSQEVAFRKAMPPSLFTLDSCGPGESWQPGLQLPIPILVLLPPSSGQFYFFHLLKIDSFLSQSIIIIVSSPVPPTPPLPSGSTPFLSVIRKEQISKT